MRERIRRTLLQVLANGCAGIVVSIAVGVFPTVTSAQTLFAWPDDRPDYAQYHSAEECLSATMRMHARIRDSLFSGKPWEEVPPIDLADSEYPDVVDFARSCSARFDVNTIDSASLMTLFHLFLVAQRDVDADVVVKRRLANIAANDDSARAVVLLNAFQTAIGMFKGIFPARISYARQLLAQIDSSPLVPLLTRFTLHDSLASYARAQMDTVLLREQFRAMQTLLSQMHESVRQGPLGQRLATRLITLEAPLELKLLQDSGGAAYAAHLRETYHQATGSVSAPLGALDMLGVRVPPLQGDFWFGPGAPATTTPSSSSKTSLVADADTYTPPSGAPALVVFDLRHDCPAGNCGPSYLMMRALARRFDETLHFALVSQTQGYFRGRPPQTPEQEANAIRRYFLDDLQLPGVLAVEQTAFVKRDAPDGRRFNELTGNQLAYHIRAPLSHYARLSTPYAYIVAPDGIIIGVTNFQFSERNALFALLQAMVPASSSTARSTP